MQSWKQGILLGVMFLDAALPAAAQPGSRLLTRDHLSQVSAHTWTITGSPNVGIVVGTHGTLVIDNGLGTRNGKSVSDIAMSLSPKGNKVYLTTTHYHAEHATGDGGFPPGTVLVRPRVQQVELEAEGQKLIDLFSSRSEEDHALLQDYRYLKPDVLFDSDYRLDLGGVSVRIAWFGAAHTKGDELIMVEPDSVLFSGDVVQNKTGPFFYCADCTPKSWLAVLDKVAALNPKIVVPDHSPVGDGSLITQERAFMADLQRRAMALKAQGVSGADAGKTIAAELQTKYAGWSSMARIPQAVEKAYSDPS
ncbi:MAG TPA: MBL fold metallo-hydrolase [Rhizomicrobium sp.]|nr:MBL fold metallo-hydrolase [Rhizomicrobium sp.]